MESMRGDRAAATRQDLYVIREWLRRAERDAEPGAGRIMSEYERECLRRIIDKLVVRDAATAAVEFTEDE